MKEKTVNFDFDFSWRFHNFQVRLCHDTLSGKREISQKYPIELVKWKDDTHKTCYTVAMWKLDEYGYELHFVGSRPFEDISPDEIAEVWKQLQAAQKMLDAFFEANEEIYE